MTNNDGYDRVMKELWNIKENIYQEVKKRGLDDYIRYIKEENEKLNEKDSSLQNSK